MNTYIVTGATGFLGQNFVNNLLNDGENVIVIVKDKSIALKMWGNHVSIIQKDLEDIDSISIDDINDLGLEKIFIHFAWNGTSGDKRADEALQLNNIENAIKVVKYAKRLGCTRFLNAGSIMEYEVIKMIEEDYTRPSKNSIYSLAKLSANFIMKTIAGEVGMEYVNVIISNIYGPGERSERFINRLIRNMLKDEVICLTEGLQKYDFIYIDDALKMIKAVAERGKVFESYYIGNPIQKSLKEFVIEVKEVIGSESTLLFGAIPNSGNSLSYREFDCLKVQTLGVYPEVSFADGIRKTRDWILNET